MGRSRDLADGTLAELNVDSNTLYVDSTNNRVGVGTASPSYPLHTTGSGSVVGVGNIGTELKLQNASTVSDAGSGSGFASDGSTASVGAWAGPITFYSGNNGTTKLERMRIDSSGALLLGVTTAQGAKLVCSNGGNTPNKYSSASAALFSSTNGGNSDVVEIMQGRYDKSCLALSHTNIGSQSMVAFRVGQTTISGQISATQTTVTYATSSDYRLKTDVQPMTGATDRLKQLKPVNFEWISSGERVDGFLAHEAQEVVPEAITGIKDGMKTEEYEITPAVEATYDEEGNELTPAVEAVRGTREVPDYQGIDQAKLVPLLTAALQEAIAKIESLETEMITVKSRLDALESA